MVAPCLLLRACVVREEAAAGTVAATTLDFKDTVGHGASPFTQPLQARYAECCTPSRAFCII